YRSRIRNDSGNRRRQTHRADGRQPNYRWLSPHCTNRCRRHAAVCTTTPRRRNLFQGNQPNRGRKIVSSSRRTVQEALGSLGYEPHVMITVDLNCDMGETPGNQTECSDELLLPYITSANIACGFHA